MSEWVVCETSGEAADDITDSMDMSLSELWEMVKDREAWKPCPWGHKQSDTTEQLNNNK